MKGLGGPHSTGGGQIAPQFSELQYCNLSPLSTLRAPPHPYGPTRMGGGGRLLRNNSVSCEYGCVPTQLCTYTIVLMQPSLPPRRGGRPGGWGSDFVRKNLSEPYEIGPPL